MTENAAKLSSPSYLYQFSVCVCHPCAEANTNLLCIVPILSEKMSLIDIHLLGALLILITRASTFEKSLSILLSTLLEEELLALDNSSIITTC